MASSSAKTEHQLKNTWILWHHDSETDWSAKSYKYVQEFNSIEGFWKLYNILPSVSNHYFYLMKKGHMPMWEVPENIDGGQWLFKISKKQADENWLKFSCYLIGETLFDNTDNIIGIGISPKVSNVIISIWNCNSLKAKNLQFNKKYGEFNVNDQAHYMQPLYKDFRERDVSSKP